MEAKTLHLTLKKKWFDMILSGEKKEEYREKKDYWINRLCDLLECWAHNSYDHFNHFDTITFRNGYASEAPTMVIELKSISIGVPKPEWGGMNNEPVFVLSLGKILSTKNIKDEHTTILP